MQFEIAHVAHFYTGIGNSLHYYYIYATSLNEIYLRLTIKYN